MNKTNEEVMILLDELYVPKKYKDSFSELVKMIGDDEIVRHIPNEKTPAYTRLPYIHIKTAGKGTRETFKGYERGFFEIIAIRGRYCFGYDSNSREFARLSSDSPRKFLCEMEGRK